MDGTTEHLAARLAASRHIHEHAVAKVDIFLKSASSLAHDLHVAVDALESTKMKVQHINLRQELDLRCWRAPFTTWNSRKTTVG